MKFIIFAPSFNEISGGIIVQHKLCHLLNELGHEAYLFPYAYSYELSRFNLIETSYKFLKWSVYNTLKRYKVNESFNTPIFKGNVNFLDDFIVIYPEVTFGNPLNAKHVVRWLLHKPGFHEGHFYYGMNEFIIKFNSAIGDYTHYGSYVSKNYLKVIHYPLEHYNQKNAYSRRKGVSYCIRKGKGKNHIKDHAQDTLIDGLSHEKVADIFKKTEIFISYDTYTAYSLFATLCGCVSIVVPDEGVSEHEWYPDKKDRYGISYGESNLEWAKNTRHLVHRYIKSEENANYGRVRSFVDEVRVFFNMG